MVIVDRRCLTAASIGEEREKMHGYEVQMGYYKTWGEGRMGRGWGAAYGLRLGTG